MTEPRQRELQDRSSVPDRSSGVIALVDDEPDDRTLIEMALRGETDLRNRPIRHIRNPQDLEEALQDKALALVVTDHRLGWSDGLQVLKRVRYRDPNIPVIFFTATGSEEVAVAALKGGARDYLTKTARHLPRLVRVIRQSLEERSTADRVRDLEERWTRLFADTPVGLYRTTRDGRTLAANEAMRTILGLDPDTPFPQAWEVYQDPEDRRRFLDRLRANGVVRDFLVPMRRRDGTSRWCSLNARLVPDPLEGEVIEGAMLDVTDRVDQERRLRKTLEATIEALALALEKRDPYTAGHGRRVAVLARRIGEVLGLDPDTRRGLYLGGLLHDIGKIAVPAEILTRPARLSQAEFQIVQSHCTAGSEILKGVAFPWPVEDMARHHHERLDGSGYPDGLEGDAISRWARILAVADVAEAMASHRPYRPALGIPAALEEIQAHRGTLYDGDAVDACVEVLRTAGIDA